jgi:hypothetical protein
MSWPPTEVALPSPCSDRSCAICCAPTAEVDAGALELVVTETPVTTAGTARAITAPAAKASNPLAAAAPMETGRLIIGLTFCIGPTSWLLTRPLYRGLDEVSFRT